MLSNNITSGGDSIELPTPKYEAQLSKMDTDLIKARRSVCRIIVLKNTTIVNYQTAFVVVNNNEHVFLITSATIGNAIVESASKVELFFEDITKNTQIRREEYDIVYADKSEEFRALIIILRNLDHENMLNPNWNQSKGQLIDYTKRYPRNTLWLY